MQQVRCRLRPFKTSANDIAMKVTCVGSVAPVVREPFLVRITELPRIDGCNARLQNVVSQHICQLFGAGGNIQIRISQRFERFVRRIVEDLIAWRDTIEALGNPIHRAFYRLILFTGLRKTEALTLRWTSIHEDHIHLAMTKNGRPFDLPTVDVHQEILEPMRGLSSDWVFPSPNSPSGNLMAPTRLQWSPHTHRRTFATVAMEAGVLEEIVGRLLNHTPHSITGQRYARPSLDALRPAMATTCAALQARMK